MSTFNQQTFRDIVNLLIPHCTDPANRRALNEAALFGCPVLEQIDWSGSVRDFTVRLVQQLLVYGACEADKPALVMVLTELRTQVGVEQQTRIDELIALIPVGADSAPDADWDIPESDGEDHVFISYSRDNLAMVRRITTDLLNAGVNVWIDQVGLKPGTLDWEQALRDAIQGGAAVLYMASPSARRSPFVRDELAIADMEGVSIYPVWVEGGEWMDCVPLGRGYVQFIDMRAGAYTNGLQQIVNALSGQPVKLDTQEAVVIPEPEPPVDESQPPRNPYKGLRAFRAEDKDDFFGRGEFVQELVVALQDGVEPPRFLCVVGPSGSGKSSVVMAGLLPTLQSGAIAGSDDWLYVDPFVPGNHPLENLAAALAKLLPEKSIRAFRDDLGDPTTRGLHLLAKQVVERPDQRLVLYIDQFEELFTLTQTERERQQFIDVLTTAVDEPDGQVVVLASLRADFYDRPLQYPQLGALMEDYSRNILPLTLADLYEVVRNPATLPDVRLQFEEGLETELVFAVREQVGALPLLQFTLDQLFERRDGRTLIWAAYNDIGGVRGALAEQAEATFAKLPSDQHKTLARALFLRLIEPGATEQDTTRRRATFNELTLPDAGQTRILQETADAFVDARLLVTDQSGDERTVEVSHEALIREWERLGDWLRDAREDLRLQKALAADVVEWKRRGQPDDMLYRGTVLTDAQSWAERNTPSRDETRFLNESARVQDARVEAEREQGLRLERMQRRARNSVLGLVVAGLILLLVLGLAFLAFQQSVGAQRAQGTAEAARGTIELQVTAVIAAQQEAEENLVVANAAGTEAAVQRATALRAAGNALIAQITSEYARQEAQLARATAEIQVTEVVAAQQEALEQANFALTQQANAEAAADQAVEARGTSDANSQFALQSLVQANAAGTEAADQRAIAEAAATEALNARETSDANARIAIQSLGTANAAGTEVANANATQVGVQMTETAIADVDGDGLSFINEVTLGTDPQLADTDRDGLSDGEEARVWQTTPINRDSDGDTLTDGDEVNLYGTNPLNPDTDGDGLRDAEDPFPNFSVTLTPTPFPISESGCPGSPAPNLKVGDAGRITEGAANNRLRDNPGVEAGEVLGLMPPGSTFTVIGGPVCDPEQFILWWQVHFEGQTGWTSGGEGDEYFVEPLNN